MKNFSQNKRFCYCKIITFYNVTKWLLQSVYYRNWNFGPLKFRKKDLGSDLRSTKNKDLDRLLNPFFLKDLDRSLDPKNKDLENL